jgi:hypothetical protein
MAMIDVVEIQTRCRAIRLRRGTLAEIAQRHPNTVARMFSGASVTTGNLLAVTAALEAEEIRLRDYLLELHPLKENAA